MFGNAKVTKMRLCFVISSLFVSLVFGPPSAPAFDVSAGPLVHSFPLTLAPGKQTEVLGPLFYTQDSGNEHVWALPPFFSYRRNPDLAAIINDSGNNQEIVGVSGPINHFQFKIQTSQILASGVPLFIH